MTKIKGKALYTPKGAALEYAQVGCNLYTGCKHDCDYCYLKRGVLSHAMGGTDVKLKSCFTDADDAVNVFTREMKKHIDYLRQVGIFFSFSTDPLITDTRYATLGCLYMANMYKVPVKILTKNADFIHDQKFMEVLTQGILYNDLVAFGFTLTGRDDMESNASPNAYRIETMRMMKAMGFRTFASIEPIIDFGSSFKMIEQAAPFCDLFKIGLRSGVKKDYYNIDECAFFIGRVTGLCDRLGFKVYWKKSIKDYICNNGKEFMEGAFVCSENFVDMDYDLFNDANLKKTEGPTLTSGSVPMQIR